MLPYWENERKGTSTLLTQIREKENTEVLIPNLMERTHWIIASQSGGEDPLDHRTFV